MATPVFCCGFECGVDTAHWSLGATTASFSTTTVRSGARSLRVNPTAATSSISIVNTTGSGGHNVARVYIRFATLPNTSVRLCGTSVGGGISNGAWYKSSDQKIYSGFTTANMGATGVSVTTGVWYRLDIYGNNSGTTWTSDVQVDGVACGQATLGGQSAVNGSFTMYFGDNTNAATFDVYFDDALGTQTAADYPLGAGYVNHFISTSDGTHSVAGANDFEVGASGVDITNATTDVYTLVRNVPMGDDGQFINMVAPPSASDYVEVVIGPASGISTPTAAPRAVEVAIGIAQSGTGVGNMEVRLNDNGTTNAVYSATGVAGTTSIAYKRKHYATAPTGGAWTVTSGAGNFNNLKARFGSPAALDVNPDQYFHCLMIEAEFEEVAAGATLTADSASYTYTPTDVSLKKGHRLVAESASYTFTTTDASLRKSIPLAAESASLTYSGSTVALKVGRVIPAAASSLTYTPTDVALKVGKLLTAESASSTYTPTDVSLKKGYRLDAQSAEYTFTGQDMTGQTGGNKTLDAQPATLNYSASNATLTVQRIVQIGQRLGIGQMTIGSTFRVGGYLDIAHYTITGSEITFTVIRGVQIDAATYAITGSTITFRRTAVIQAAEFQITGGELSFDVTDFTRLPITAATYEITGSELTFVISRGVVIEAAAYVISGEDLNFVITRANPSTDTPAAPYIPPRKQGGSSSHASVKSELQLQIEREDDEILSFINVFLKSEIL
jgi:hypothetical protein